MTVGDREGGHKYRNPRGGRDRGGIHRTYIYFRPSRPASELTDSSRPCERSDCEKEKVHRRAPIALPRESGPVSSTKYTETQNNGNTDGWPSRASRLSCAPRQHEPQIPPMPGTLKANVQHANLLDTLTHQSFSPG